MPPVFRAGNLSGFPSAFLSDTHVFTGCATCEITCTSFAYPVAIGALHPMLGGVMAMIELAVVLTIIGTALFGSSTLSERAFRLLRWTGNRPEPPAPPPGSMLREQAVSYKAKARFADDCNAVTERESQAAGYPLRERGEAIRGPRGGI